MDAQRIREYYEMGVFTATERDRKIADLQEEEQAKQSQPIHVKRKVLQLSNLELEQILADPTEQVFSTDSTLLKTGAKVARLRPESDFFLVLGYACDGSDIKRTLSILGRS